MSSIDKMDKIGTLLPCDTAPIAPIQARATTNSVCRTNVYRRNFVSTKTIQIGNILVPIPCFLLPYEAEFRALIPQVGYLKAVKLLAEKYNVDIRPPLQTIIRYKYPNVNENPVYKTIQFQKTFVLAEPAPTVPYTPVHQNWSIRFSDAKYVDVCNDDGVTFSKTYTDMKQYATYWVSHIPAFDKPIFVVIQGTNAQRIPHVGRFVLTNNRVVFIPIVLNVLFILYQAYPSNTPFSLLYADTFENTKVRIQSLLATSDASCKHRFHYPRFEPFTDLF